jgi:hypothetical protein
MSFFNKTSNEPPRIWGQNKDGSQYISGMTVGELRRQLAAFNDTDEVCMSVRNKKDQGFIGKLKSAGPGADGQMWLQGGVIDESLE